MNEDLAPFFSDFAVPARVGGVNVRAIFDNGSATADIASLGMATRSPTLMLRTASVPASPVGQQVVVCGRAYTIAEHQPDGTGVSTLVLEAAS